MFARLGRLLCVLGLHTLEKKPAHKELVKATGNHIVFFSEGVQQGVKKCLRPGCHYSIPVWRIGWVGSGDSSGWMRLSEKQKQYIDSLPIM